MGIQNLINLVVVYILSGTGLSLDSRVHVVSLARHAYLLLLLP